MKHKDSSLEGNPHSGHFELMPNNDENNQQRNAGRSFDQDTDEAFPLPKPTPELGQDDDEPRSDEKRADSIDDQEIEVDEDEVKAESESESPGRKY